MILNLFKQLIDALLFQLIAILACYFATSYLFYLQTHVVSFSFVRDVMLNLADLADKIHMIANFWTAQWMPDISCSQWSTRDFMIFTQPWLHRTPKETMVDWTIEISIRLRWLANNRTEAKSQFHKCQLDEQIYFNYLITSSLIVHKSIS